jgi:hypothetical protein
VCLLPVLLWFTPPVSAATQIVDVETQQFEDGFQYWRRGPSQRCLDEATLPSQQRVLFDRVHRKVEAAGGGSYQRFMEIPADFAVAPPGRYWTVRVGDQCGTARQSEHYFVVDRQSGSVLGPDEFQRDDYVWKRIGAHWVKQRRIPRPD